MNQLPSNPDVEKAVVGAILADPSIIAEVVGQGLEAVHFYVAPFALLYDEAVKAYYDGTTVDPLTLGELNAVKLSKLWGCDERTAVGHVQTLAALPRQGDTRAHAELVKRDADYRALLKILDEARTSIADESAEPEQVAGVLTSQATRVATSSALTYDLVSFADSGRQFLRDAKEAQAATRAGMELGAYFGIAALDRFTRGLQPQELFIGAGEPGIGKSAVYWAAGLGFARRQAKRPKDRQVGTLILSLEMGQKPSNMRFASMLTGVDSAEIREGTVSDQALKAIVDEWRKDMDIPLWMSYAPTLRASQLRAIISEAVVKHNVGLVIIDHFKYFNLDVRLRNPVDEDGEKAGFLKNDIAKALNVAVICLAHTRKPDPGSNGRPRLSDLRGSGDISAHADFVSFIYRPWLYASERERDNGSVEEDAAEMIFAKSRHGMSGTGNFTFAPQRMYVQ